MVNLKVKFQSTNPVQSSQSTNAYSPLVLSKQEKKPNSIRILLVDDQNSIRQKLRISLEAEPDLQVVGSVEDGQTALEQIKILHPDLVLIDIEMPGMNGLMTAKAIKEQYTRTKVVIFSSYDDKNYISQALQIGAKGYLLKNTPIEEIVHAVKFVHKGYLQLSPGLYEKLESDKTTKTQNERELKHQNNSQALEVVKSQSKQIAQLESSIEQNWSSLTKELVDTLPRVWTRGLLYFLVLFISIILPWSMLSKVDETGSARGRLEPKGQTTKLDAPVPGKVTAVKVKEGQQVKSGSTLIELDSKIVSADLQEARAKINGLKERLNNFQILENQLQMNLRVQRQQNQAAAAEQQALINQTQQRISLYQSQINSIQQLTAKDRSLVKRYRQFKQEGVVSGVQLDDAERRLIENSQNLQQALSDKEQQQTELNKQNSTYKKIAHQGEQAEIEAERQLKEAQSQAIDTSSEITQAAKQISSLQHQLEQSQIEAPIAGTVFQLAIAHPGAVVQQSQLLARIAPKGTPLILKAQMPTYESGFLRLGMPVKIKFDAYPFQDYGIVEGRLSWIAPDSKIPQQQPEQTAQQAETFELEIELDSTYIQTKNKRIALTPGQTATAEVIVRQRRLIDFALDPFKKLHKGGLEL
jgi:hemolysin D